MTEAMLTAYAGRGRRLTDGELYNLVDELGLRPEVIHFKNQKQAAEVACSFNSIEIFT
jgi:hypothetical protein